MDHSKPLFEVGLRLVIAWLVLSLIGFVCREQLAAHCLPLIHGALAVIAPQFSGSLSLLSENDQSQILFDAHVGLPIAVGAELVIPFGQALPASTSVIHALVPFVLLFSVMLAWPLRGWKASVALMTLAIPTATLLLVLTTPFQLLGLIEVAIQSYANAQHAGRSEPFSLSWMLFLEGGGLWVLPLVLATVCATVAQTVGSQRTARKI